MSEKVVHEAAGIDTVKDASRNHLDYMSLLVFVLSVYVLAALAFDTIYELEEEVSRLLDIIDNMICFVFLIEFCVKFYRAESKLAYMKWGWIDLLSSIPTVGILRTGRIFRIIRLLRIFKAFRSAAHFVNYIFRDKVHGTFTTVSIVAVLLVIFSSIAILQVENDPESNIQTAEDALWWAYVTATTVGYGDKYPVTSEGRLIAAMLMTVGVGLFGTFTAFVASWFVEEKKEEGTKEAA